MRLRYFILIWCIAISLMISMLAVVFYYTSNPKAQKEILVLKINGEIDGTVSQTFRKYFHEYPQPPNYLIIQINSTGGWNSDVALIGHALQSFENLGTPVIFIAQYQCTSGCYWLSAYATQIIVEPNAVYGFGHGVENSTIFLHTKPLINSTAFVLASIQSDSSYTYSVKVVELHEP